MKSRREHLDPVELGLAELSDADRAGLFRATPVDRAWLANPDSPQASERPGWLPLLTRGRMVAAAALLVFAFGVWGLMFRHQLANLRESARTTTVQVADAASIQPAELIACLRGPVGDGVEGCQGGDLNRDGRIDLADYGTLQVAYASVSR